MHFCDLPYLLKLNASQLCRVEFWEPLQQKSICIEQTQWSFLLQEPTQGYFCGFLQNVAFLRTELSGLWSLQGVDFLGILRSLFLSESVSSQSGEWLRLLGFVHLLTASGLHLLSLFAFTESLFKKTCSMIGFSSQRARLIHRLFNFYIFAFVWVLQGFRSGFLRPLLMVGIKVFLTERGMRLKPHAALLIAVVMDALWSWIWTFFFDQTSWGMGRWHYFLAVWGGAYGWFWAQDKKWSAFYSHILMSLFSWLATMPLEFLHGNFSPYTAVLSFFTIPVIALFLYPITFFAMAIQSEFLLQWISYFWNHAVSRLAVFLTEIGAWREVTPLQALSSIMVAVVFVIIVKAYRHQRCERHP